MRRRQGVLRAPGFHFVVLGALLFALDRSGAGWTDAAQRTAAGDSVGSLAEAERIAVTASADSLTDEEILFKEALAARLDRNDPLVRRRLARLAAMVTTGNVEDEPALEREARRLGLERSDVVVRRHLAHTMALAFAHAAPREAPDEAEIAAYFEQHRERFAAPARVRFRHLFFARERGTPSATESAEHALATITQRHAGEPEPAGDPFLLGSRFDMAGPVLERTFGAAFTAALVRAVPGHWSGPVESSYGVHLLWVEAHTPAAVPALAAVRSRVVHALLADRAAARLERRLAERRAYYRERAGSS